MHPILRLTFPLLVSCCKYTYTIIEMSFSLPYLPFDNRKEPYTSYPFLVNQKTQHPSAFLKNSCTSSSLALFEKSPGVDAVAPVIWALPNMTCIDSKLSDPKFLKVTCLHLFPFARSFHLCNEMIKLGL
jgi:hypothetical protein